MATIILAANMSSTQAFDLFGLRPGMTLSEAQAKGTLTAKSQNGLRIGRLNEVALDGKLLEIIDSQVEQETALGIVTCLAIAPDPANVGHPTQAVLELNGVDVEMWLPFVRQSGVMRLAEIVLYPCQASDSLDHLVAFTELLGEPQIVKRRFDYGLVLHGPERVFSWQMSGKILDLNEKDFVHFYDPALIDLLRKLLMEVQGRSFFFSLPGKK